MPSEKLSKKGEKVKKKEESEKELEKAKKSLVFGRGLVKVTGEAVGGKKVCLTQLTLLSK